VWTDLFYAVERLIEGDRRERMKKDAAADPMKLERISENRPQHSIWLLIAWWTGGAWVLYFNDAPTLVKQLVTFQAPMVAYLWNRYSRGHDLSARGLHAGAGLHLYVPMAAHRQAALTDEWALNVTYRYDRGEKRTSVKKAARTARAWRACRRLRRLLSMRRGLSDRHRHPQRPAARMHPMRTSVSMPATAVMKKIGRETRLIGYDNDINIHRREAGKPPIYRVVRPRTIVYSSIIAVVGAIMLYTLVTRSLLDVNVLHDRNPVAVKLSDGSIRNAIYSSTPQQARLRPRPSPSTSRARKMRRSISSASIP